MLENTEHAATPAAHVYKATQLGRLCATTQTVNLCISYGTFFGTWQYSVLSKVCPFLTHISWSPTSHSAHFFLSIVSKGVSPCTGKVGPALHSPLELAPSQASHLGGVAVWSKERYNDGGHSWGGPPRGVRATGKGSRGLREHCPTISPSSLSTSLHCLQITTSPTCSAFL